mgnify:CR=1 FL=1
MKKRKDIRITCTTRDVFRIKHDSYDTAQIDELCFKIMDEEGYIIQYFPLRNILQIEFIEVEK